MRPQDETINNTVLRDGERGGGEGEGGGACHTSYVHQCYFQVSTSGLKFMKLSDKRPQYFHTLQLVHSMPSLEPSHPSFLFHSQAKKSWDGWVRGYSMPYASTLGREQYRLTTCT